MKLDIDLAWSSPVTDCDGSRDTADPLGFRSFANQLARDLVPSLTQVTRRTRGYALLCKGLALALAAEKKRADPVDVFLRFERLWVGAQRAVHGEKARWAGVRMAQILLNDGNYRLDRALTTQQLYSGIWGTYRRSATALGLIQPQGRRSGPAGYRLTALGSEMTSAVTKAAFAERVHLTNHVSKASLPIEVLQSLIIKELPGHQASEGEVEQLSEAMRAADRAWDNALQRLRRAYDRSGTGSLDLSELDVTGLSDVQQRATGAARELRELMEAVEKPYRLWVTGASVETILPATWKHPGWGTIRQWPIPELVTLHESVRSAGKGIEVFETLHKHHTWLMEQRGAEAWEQDIETRARSTYQAPDFCLPSATQLFAEGVLLGAHA